MLNMYWDYRPVRIYKEIEFVKTQTGFGAQNVLATSHQSGQSHKVVLYKVATEMHTPCVNEQSCRYAGTTQLSTKACTMVLDIATLGGKNEKTQGGQHL